MLNPKRELFRWGPIPGRLISIDDWSAIFQLYPGRLHRFSWSDSYQIFRNGEMLFVSDMHDFERVAGRVFQQIFDRKSLTRYQKAWQASVRNLFDYCRSITATRLSGLPDRALEIEWKKFHELLKHFWEPAVIPELAAYGGAPKLRRLLMRHGLNGEALQTATARLSAPELLSFYQEEERDFLKLFRLRSKTARYKALKNHNRQYYWIENSYGAVQFLALTDFQRQLRDRKQGWLQRARAIDRHIATVRLEKARVIREYRLSKTICRTADRLSLAIGWQDERKKQIFRYLHFQELFLREFSRRSGVPLVQLSTAMVSEVVSKPTRQKKYEWRRRYKYPHVLILGRRVHRVLSGASARKIVRDFFQTPKPLQRKELTGIVAHSGSARIIGRVFVVRNHEQLKRFPAGAILVSTQTAPEYVAAIRKAKAIVTDAGGITSHAAIVAREYDKPCIVGTKYATSILRTGDRIAVDARKGLVIKL